MNIGLITPLDSDGRCFEQVAGFGLDVCQLVSWDMSLATRETAVRVVRESRAAGVRVSAMWAGVPGPAVWNFAQGPVTLGLVPGPYRRERVEALKRWADFACRCGIPAIITHCGFIPENMTDPDYPPVVEAIREAAAYCESLGIGFWFETGQETPVVLRRTIERVGTSNLGINYDPANLICYGKGHPIDALPLLGPYIRNVHAKDGVYPPDGETLGVAVPIGEGNVRFPEFLAALKRIGYRNELIIEREITGERQARDIRRAIADLRRWLREGEEGGEGEEGP